MFKFKYIVLVVPILLLALAGCQPQNPVARSLSAAGSIQDVIDAWDMHCGAFNFDSCPPDAADELTCAKTMGDMYNGGTFEQDSELFMDAIRNELLVDQNPSVEIDDLLNAVISDSLWFT